MSKDNLRLGRQGEEEAVKLLKKSGYKILFRNYKTKLGELDIIAKDKESICFVEVKARRSDAFGLPQEAVQLSKQKQISKAALSFLKESDLLDKRARFDVVSVLYSSGEPKLELIKGAFELGAQFTY